MDLKEFTKQTLIQIVEGAKEANSAISEHNAQILRIMIMGTVNLFQ